MKIHLKLDNEKRIIWYSIPFEGEVIESGVLEADVDFSLIVLGQTKFQNGILVQGTTYNPEILTFLNEANEHKRIDELKELLNNSDFKVIKCYEADMLDEPMPYDFVALVSERKAWREELNELEARLAI